MNSNNTLRLRHSFYGAEAPKEDLGSDTTWKSEMNVAVPMHTNIKVNKRTKMKGPSHSAEYYKRYEHDEIPVKDDSKKIHNELADNCGNGASLTNSELEKLEKKIYQNISQELQTDNSSVSSLESNLKLFKTTVQEIFDNFYTCMHDFEAYKKRYEEILAKNKEDSMADMECFIKDMICHIMSSESCLSSESRKWEDMPAVDAKDAGDTVGNTTSSEKQAAMLLESLHSVVEAYKNESYQTDSTFEDNPKRLSSNEKKEEIFNIYLLRDMPCVQIKMNDRNLLSEINIKDPSHQDMELHVASAENLKKMADKKLELDEYVKQQQDVQAPDREIPVKVSFAKKNIHLNEDFTNDTEKDENRSLMAKICSYICKKFRKI